MNEHIKTKQFARAYLLYGEEEYLKQQYKSRLKEAIVGEDTMNVSYYDGSRISVQEVMDMGSTLPFFADHRLLILEDSGFFKSSCEELADYVKNMPDYLIMLFVEKEVDKRNRLYKAVSSVGYVSELNPQSQQVLEKWITGMVRQAGKQIQKEAISVLLAKTGADMENIYSEMEKLYSYCMDQPVITAADVEAICTTQINSSIFDMITAVAMKEQQKALQLYYDMLTQKEPPMRILSLITRQLNGILQVLESGASGGYSDRELAGLIGVAPFVVGKYRTQARKFTKEQLIALLSQAADNEEAFKTSRMTDKMAVELLLIQASS